MATVTFIRYRRQSAGVLKGVCQYVSQNKKTLSEEGLKLISGRNCTPMFAQQEFLATRTTHRKDSPIYFYHYVQSFLPEETVDGPAAHALAREFAAKAWPESEVLIATHVDAGHIHSHFIVNSVCFETGSMLRQGPKTLERLRTISDELCKAHNLSVLEDRPDSPSEKMSAREYRAAEKGQSWKLLLEIKIDEAMRFAGSRAEFIALMASEGYQIRWTPERKDITYTTPTGMKCRCSKLHGKKYRKEQMEHEFTIRKAIAGGIESPPAQTV